MVRALTVLFSLQVVGLILNMESILSKMENLSIVGEEQRKLGGYFASLRTNKKFWYVEERNEFIVSDYEEKTYFILKITTCNDQSAAVLCTKCMQFKSILSLKQSMRVKENIQSESCFHALVCYLLFPPNQLVEADIKEYEDKNIVRALPIKKNYLAVILPARGNTGLVYKNKKTARPKCYTCSGGDCCLHLR